MKRFGILLLLTTALSYGSYAQDNPFIGTWDAKYRLDIAGNDTTKTALDGHQQFFISITTDSYDMYYSGNKILSVEYEIKNEVITAEGSQLTIIDPNTIYFTDILGKVHIYLHKAAPPVFDDPPAELLEVWIGESKYLTNSEGDTVNYSSGKSSYTNEWTVGFTEAGKMYSYLPGHLELYSVDYRLLNDTIWLVEPFQIGNETFYNFGERYYVIRKLDDHTFVYGDGGLGGEFLYGFRKTYSRGKSTFDTPPEHLAGSWSGAYSYLMDNKDTIRMHEASSFLGIATEARPVDTTNTKSYQFLPDNVVKYYYAQSEPPAEFKYEVKNGRLRFFKFPININGEEKFMGLDTYPVEVLTDSELTIRDKLRDGTYQLDTFIKSESSPTSYRYIIGLRRNGQKVGIWGSYHENDNLKQITYYWSPGFPRLELNFDPEGKYIESDDPDRKVVRLKNSISFTDESESYLLLLKLFENEKPSHIEFHREGKLMLSIELDSNSEIIEKNWFDLGLAKYRTD